MLTVVVGNVCSGKSTYVREHADPGDVVVDLDVIAQALGSPVAHGHEDNLRYVAVKARNAAVKQAAAVSNRVNVWIIDSCVPQWRRELYERHNARWVTLDVPPDVLHERASRERPDLWHTLIDEWAKWQEDAGPSWRSPWPGTLGERKPWPKRPAHRRGAHGHRYEKLRAAFLAGRTHCENPDCGVMFVTDAPCNHRACRSKRDGAGGCHFFHAYPTVDHSVPLVTGMAAPLDTSLWRALCYSCNQSAGGKLARARQLGRAQDHNGGTVDLSW